MVAVFGQSLRKIDVLRKTLKLETLIAMNQAITGWSHLISCYDFDQSEAIHTHTNTHTHTNAHAHIKKTLKVEMWDTLSTRPNK